MPAKLIDITGQKFGRLFVIKKVGKTKWRKILWLCKCDCGIEKIIASNNLKNGGTKSCGCLQIENTIKANRTHGMRHKKVSKTWRGMKGRCYNPKNPSYHRYGGRNIEVCERWHKFENFYNDMGDVPKGMTLERLDNNGNYTPENCIWATAKEQANNRSNNRLITYNGKTQNMKRWSKELNIGYGALKNRLDTSNWSIKKAFETPYKPYAKIKNTT